VVAYKLFRFSQEMIVALIAVLLFLVFSTTQTAFRTTDNLLSLLQNVSILGILGADMALSIIGRGIDLSIVTVMTMTPAWILQLVNSGTSLEFALLLGLVSVTAVGLINGVLIAWLEVPAIFATLGMATVHYGFMRSVFLNDNQVYLKASVPDWFHQIGSGTMVGIPSAVVIFALVCVLVQLFLRYDIWGRFLYAMGENPAAARITGIASRPLTLLQYTLCSAIGLLAGIILASSVESMDTRIALSTMVYDVVMVVVIGGIGLSGGKGGMRNVLVGTVLVGILLNGMTIMDVSYTAQNVIKSLVLMLAVIVDSIVNPRDEQTAQQGDI